jgi:hypothetical protein
LGYIAQVQAWLGTEAQLQRVLQALTSLLDRLPVLERAAAAASAAAAAVVDDDDAPHVPAAALACQASYVKQVLEAERLAAYLAPLM